MEMPLQTDKFGEVSFRFFQGVSENFKKEISFFYYCNIYNIIECKFCTNLSAKFALKGAEFALAFE